MSTFIAELVALVLIIFIIARYIVPVITRGLGERQQVVSKQVVEAEEARRRLGEAETAYQNAVHEARTEAAQIRESARAEAQRTVEELKAAAEEESARIVTRGEEQLQSQRAAVVRDLRAEIGTLAAELSEQIVEQRLAQEGQVSATVDAFLAGLEARDDAADGSRTNGGETR